MFKIKLKTATIAVAEKTPRCKVSTKPRQHKRDKAISTEDFPTRYSSSLEEKNGEKKWQNIMY